MTSAEDSELDSDSTDTDSNEEHHDDSLLVPKRADLLEAFSVLDPAGLIGQDAIAEEHLEILLDHYNEDGAMGINKVKRIDEYRDFTSFAKSHKKLKLCTTLQELAIEVLGNKSIYGLFPLVSQLIVHALVLPTSTTDCERCFSTMKRVKTESRNRMNTQILDKLLRVGLEASGETEFNFKEAAQCWVRAKYCRLFS